MTEEIKWASVPMNELIELRDECDRLEHENKVNLSRAKDLNTELQRLTDENFNLKQSLKEIREIINTKAECDKEKFFAVAKLNRIEDKINEVLK